MQPVYELYNELQGWLFQIYGRINFVSHCVVCSRFIEAPAWLHVLVRMLSGFISMCMSCLLDCLIVHVSVSSMH